MTLITRYNPLESRLFEPFFRFPVFQEETQPSWNPPVDILEEQDRIFVKVEVPGIDESNLKVMFEDGLLTVTGERQFERKDTRSYHRIERSYGTFTRKFSLPRSIDASRIAAEYRNGILEISIPKKEEAKPRQIEISVNEKTLNA